MAETTQHYEVYLGPWINWSQGRILGATITLTKQDAGLLTSFIALFVGVAGAAFWRLACFGLHKYLSSNNPRDGLYHQRQAILRNTATSLGGLQGLCQMLWAWRRSTRRPYARLLPFIIFSLLTVSCFTVAGIFSSQIGSSQSSEALIRPMICGTMISAVAESIDGPRYFGPQHRQLLRSADDYARRCYTSNSSTELCRPYVKERLPMKVTTNVSCPFANTICQSNTRNIHVDSGLLDSREHFGLNSPNHFQLRLVSSCAPLATEGYTMTTNRSLDGANQTWIQYYYGDNLTLYSRAHNLTWYNQTYHGNETDLFTYQYPQRPAGDNNFDDVFSAYPDYTLG